MVVTDLADNPGPCVTNSVEVIAELVWQLVERPDAGMVLIQEYRSDSLEIRRRGQEFAIVAFMGPGRFECPDWLPVQRSAVEAMLDGPVA